MNLQDKSREEIINALQELEHQNRKLLSANLKLLAEQQSLQVHNDHNGLRGFSEHQMCESESATIGEHVAEKYFVSEQLAKNNERLQSIVDILQYEAGTLQEFLDHALNELIRLTDSKIGYIYYYDEEKQEFELNTWSKDVMKECSVAESQNIYCLDKTGLWGEVVRQRKPIMNNNFANFHPDKKGYPEGHVILNKFLTIPVIYQKNIVAVAGVANKIKDYDQTDILQMTLLMDAVWKTTERLKSEQALRENKDLLHEVSQIAKLGGWSLDLKTKKVSWTEETYRIHEVDFNTQPILDDGIGFYAPEAQPVLREAIDKALTQGSPFDLELPFITAKGRHLWVRSIGKVVFVDGKPDHLYGVFQDITDRKKLEGIHSFLLSCGMTGDGDQFFESLAKYLSQILDMEYVCIDKLEGDGLTAHTVAIYNDGQFDTNITYTLKQTPCGEVVGKTICCFPENVCTLFPQDSALQELNAESYVGTTLMSYEGSPIGLIAVIGRKPLENPTFAESVLKLVSIRAAGELERKIAEETLRKSEEHIRLLLNSTAEAIFGIDLNGICTFCNSSCVKQLGYADQDDLLGKNVHKLVHKKTESGSESEMKDCIIYNAFIKGENTHLADEVFCKADGTNFPVEFWSYPQWQDGKITGAVVTFLDITERKMAEAEIKFQNEELKKLNSQKDKFFSIIAHDLKSPFNSIVGFAELLMQQVKEKDFNGIEKYTEIILNSSERAMGLLINLMEWSCSQTGRMEFNPEYFEMVELIDQNIELFEDIAIRKGISIKKEMPSHAPVYADKAMINTVLRNLISNAIKFTRLGGKIIISVKEQKTELIISVRDNGVGISSNVMVKLFRLDENYTSNGTQNEKGTGLGLILCKEFIENHGGKIWVESEVEKGSEFHFSIPLNLP